MRLATIKLHGAEVAGIVTGKGILPVAALNAYKGTGWKEDMMSLIQANHIPGLTKWYNEGGKEELETIPGVVPAEEVVYAPLYRNPKRIFGIGLNYADHAKDIGNAAPTGFPGSFFKMADTLIGPNDDILLPKLKEAQKTTAEAELGIIDYDVHWAGDLKEEFIRRWTELCGVTVLTVTTAFSPSMRVRPAGRVVMSRAMIYSMTVSRLSLTPR